MKTNGFLEWISGASIYIGYARYGQLGGHGFVVATKYDESESLEHAVQDLSAGDNEALDAGRFIEAAGLTLEQAGALVYTSWRTWQNWEADADSAEHRRMHPSTWELFQVKLAARSFLAERSLTPAHVRALGLYLPDPD